jgi:hypothetical protein
MRKQADARPAQCRPQNYLIYAGKVRPIDSDVLSAATDQPAGVIADTEPSPIVRWLSFTCSTASAARESLGLSHRSCSKTIPVDVSTSVPPPALIAMILRVGSVTIGKPVRKAAMNTHRRVIQEPSMDAPARSDSLAPPQAGARGAAGPPIAVSPHSFSPLHPGCPLATPKGAHLRDGQRLLLSTTGSTSSAQQAGPQRAVASKFACCMPARATAARDKALREARQQDQRHVLDRPS